jgi:hypothetical protein
MLEGIGIEMAEITAQLLASEAAVTAVLHWREVTKPEGWDANDESSMAGAVFEPKQMEFRALKHQVDHRLSGFQRFMEVQTGDVILDYAQELALDGKEDVRIEINGRFYVQKNASAALLEAWDVEMGSGGTMKSVLLTPAG